MLRKIDLLYKFCDYKEAHKNHLSNERQNLCLAALKEYIILLTYQLQDMMSPNHDIIEDPNDPFSILLLGEEEEGFTNLQHTPNSRYMY